MFDPWVGKIPWRRACQPTPLFLPGESHGQRSLEGYSPWGRKRVGHPLVTEQQQGGRGSRGAVLIWGWSGYGEKVTWSRKWQPAPVFLSGKFYGQRSLEGYSPWGHKESDATEQPNT